MNEDFWMGSYVFHETPQCVAVEEPLLPPAPPRQLSPVSLGYPAQRVVITLAHPTVGDALFAPLLRQALIEFMTMGASKSHYDFVALNGMHVKVDVE